MYANWGIRPEADITTINIEPRGKLHLIFESTHEMISRGHYLGEIIDEFAAIAGQVKMRNVLGFTDLTVYAENFFRDVLNILLAGNLKNLNQERANEPGLDLGDESAELGVQVTSTATASKVNSTLQKITAEQAKSYKKIVVLVIGKKQSSYSIDPDLSTKYNFSETNIWDLDDLARKAIGLELDDLQRLHRLIRSEVARLKVELEIPDQEGKYPTSGFDKWEKRIKPKVGDGAEFAKFIISTTGEELNAQELKQLSDALKKLGRRLSRLPRITREFLAMLYERREKGRSKRFGNEWAHLLYSKVEREYRGDDLKGELEILEHAGFVRMEFEDTYSYGPPQIGILITHDSDHLAFDFLDFIKNKNLDIRTVIGQADLSAF